MYAWINYIFWILQWKLNLHREQNPTINVNVHASIFWLLSAYPFQCFCSFETGTSSKLVFGSHGNTSQWAKKPYSLSPFKCMRTGAVAEYAFSYLWHTKHFFKFFIYFFYSVTGSGNLRQVSNETHTQFPRGWEVQCPIHSPYLLQIVKSLL